MISRVRLTSVAILLLLVSASVSFAQQPDSTASARIGARAGRGAVGFLVGGSWIYGGGDYAKGAQPRFSILGSYRYIISPSWRWQVSPFMTWAAYRTGASIPFRDPNFPDETTKDDYLTQVVGGNAQIQRMWGKANYRWHLGVGPALYRVVVQNHRKVLKDPDTFRLHQGQYLGLTAEYGVERFMKSLPNTSLEWTVALHGVSAKRNDQFPNGFNDMPQLFEFRFGSHYYFDFKSEKKSGATPAPRH